MIWTLHTRTRNGRLERARVVPDAPARWALVFGSLWLLRHRMWWEAALFLLLTLLANRVATLAFGGEANLASLLTYGLLLLPRLWLMLEGNEMRRAKLARDGFEEVGITDASDEEGAQAALLRGFAHPVPSHADLAMARSS